MLDGAKIPVVLCVDAEPDERDIAPDRPEDWRGFEACCEMLAQLRPSLESATRSPVHFSWFLKMDPQIGHTYGSISWAADRYCPTLLRLASDGDHLGLHVHPWRWDAPSQVWIEDFANQAWVEQCITSGAAAFRSSLDSLLQSFRGGDRWLNNATVELLERLGFQYDLTIEPGNRGSTPAESVAGNFPDYAGAPLGPYHPGRDDFRRPGTARDHSIWMIPLSAGGIHAPRRAAERLAASTSWSISRPGGVTTGRITASPNPILVPGPDDAGATTLTWTSEGTKEVEVHVDAPNGPLFSHTGPTGRGETGQWVSNGSVLYLQDVSDGLALTPENTLSTVCVNVTVDDARERAALNEPEEYMTLNLAFNSLVFARIVDHLLRTRDKPYLAIAMRSDTPLRKVSRYNLEQNLEHLRYHPLIEHFVFTTPPGLIARLER